MKEFIFIDSLDETYLITFGWRERNTCTISTYPKKFDEKSLAMCSFKFTDKIIIDEEYEHWADEFLSDEVIDHINRLIDNKVFW
jgi:hypothetical protein